MFCGVGGLSYGFHIDDNFDIILANDSDPDTAKAYELNHPGVPILALDIKDAKIDLQADIVVGGPPCQSYSTLGKRRNDDKAQLYKEFVRVLEVIKPKIFIYENVVGLLSMEGGQLFKEIKEEFKRLGYDIVFQILNAANFGIPQVRERVIVVGTRSGREFQFPKPTHGAELLPYVTLGDALGDLPRMTSGQESHEYATMPQNDFQRFVRRNNPILTENKTPNNGEHLIRLMQALPDGGTKNDLPQDLKPKSGYWNTYAKLWWARPSTTITRNFSCVSSSRCIHPRDSRALTTREGARLQSFPDCFKFYGSRGKKNLQIGNAVPPMLSIRLAQQVLKCLEGGQA